MLKYIFKGTVYVENTRYADQTFETFATSLPKAVSNFKYQFKKKRYYPMNTALVLIGTVTDSANKIHNL